MPTINCYDCHVEVVIGAEKCPKCGAPALDTLIMVPGHAVYVGNEKTQSKITAHWLGTFGGYQENDEAELYYEHVRTGVLLSSRGRKKGERSKSLLIFSGGETRRKAGPYAEAQSYWFLAKQNNWFEHPGVENRATTEEFARDSFENLLFSLHRFRQCTGRLPTHIIVCGFTFKTERYELHWATVCKYHSDPRVRLEMLDTVNARFLYVGVNDPPPYLLQGPGGSKEGENDTRGDWEKDPLGEKPPLRVKELERDPYMHYNPYGIDRSAPVEEGETSETEENASTDHNEEETSPEDNGK